MIYDYQVKDAEGKVLNLSEYKGKVLLIINSATGCGLTPQYEGLQKLYDTYQKQGFEILDFPCNQFGNQAPGSNEQIKTFCESRFGVTFKVLDKIDVNGENESPLFAYLKKEKKGIMGSKIKWNFTKFLVDRNGNVIKRYSPTDKPERIMKDLEALL